MPCEVLDVKVTSGGVVMLRKKDAKGIIHVFPPHTWYHFDYHAHPSPDELVDVERYADTEQL